MAGMPIAEQINCVRWRQYFRTAIHAKVQSNSTGTDLNWAVVAKPNLADMRLPGFSQIEDYMPTLDVLQQRIHIGKRLQAQLQALIEQKNVIDITQKELEDESSVIKSLLGRATDDVDRVRAKKEKIQTAISETEEVLSIMERQCFRMFPMFHSIAEDQQSAQISRLRYLHKKANQGGGNIKIVEMVMEENQREKRSAFDESHSLVIRVKSILALAKEEEGVSRAIRMLIEQISSPKFDCMAHYYVVAEDRISDFTATDQRKYSKGQP